MYFLYIYVTLMHSLLAFRDEVVIFCVLGQGQGDSVWELLGRSLCGIDFLEDMAFGLETLLEWMSNS